MRRTVSVTVSGGSLECESLTAQGAGSAFDVLKCNQYGAEGGSEEQPGACRRGSWGPPFITLLDDGRRW